MLTELAVRKLSAKGSNRVEMWDEKLPGFGVRASGAGTKTFVLMYYLGGRKRRMTLGRFPILTLTAARQKAIEALALVGRGIDPMAGAPASSHQYRFADVVGAFVEQHCQRHNRENHAREVERILRARFLAAWGKSGRPGNWEG